MMLRAAPLTDDKIHLFSFGRVDNPLSEPTHDWEEARGSLFDPRTFGYHQDWRCACGKYRGEVWEGFICDICGVRVGEARALQRQRFGHVDLAAPVPHPLAEGPRVAAIAVLPIAYRSREGDGADLNALYVELIRANEEAKQGQLGPDVESAKTLARKVAELYCNEWTEQPRTWQGRPLRSLAYLLLESPEISPERVGVLLRGLGLKLELREEPL